MKISQVTLGHKAPPLFFFTMSIEWPSQPILPKYTTDKFPTIQQCYGTEVRNCSSITWPVTDADFYSTVVAYDRI